MHFIPLHRSSLLLDSSAYIVLAKPSSTGK